MQMQVLCNTSKIWVRISTNRTIVTMVHEPWAGKGEHDDNIMLTAGFDLLLRDATFWPAAVLQDMLAIPSVDVLPMSVLMPLNERLGVPNSVAYIPQMSTPFTPGMVISAHSCVHHESSRAHVHSSASNMSCPINSCCCAGDDSV